jgi:ribonuclease R
MNNNQKAVSSPTHEGVIMIRGKGTGFVAVPGFDEDIVIYPEHLNRALDGDVVSIQISPSKSQEYLKQNEQS